MRARTSGNGKGKAHGKAKVHRITDRTSAFTLEADPVAGEVPERVVEELRALKVRANETAAAFSEAVKVQSEKHKLKAGALRRYVSALVTDKTEDVESEARQLVGLFEH